MAPYAVGARTGAPVATPLAWVELGWRGAGPRRHTMANLLRRLGQRPDPWADIGDGARPLDGARRRLDALLGERSGTAT